MRLAFLPMSRHMKLLSASRYAFIIVIGIAASKPLDQ
jgi:hypothetical protein